MLTELFKLQKERARDWKIDINLSITQIYNEVIMDLLNPESTKRQLEVKQNSDGSVAVPGLTERDIFTASEAFQCIQSANSNRATTSTNMNETSSRSHAIVTIRTTSLNKDTNQIYDGSTKNICFIFSSKILFKRSKFKAESRHLFIFTF